LSSHFTAKRDPIRPSEGYCYISDSKLAEDVVIDAKWDSAEVLGLEGGDPKSDEGEGRSSKQQKSRRIAPQYGSP
jgi:hypothetical protein